MIDTSLFPYESFGVRLEIPEENKIAWFKDDIDLQKHLNRYKLDKGKIKILHRDNNAESTEHSKIDKSKIRQRTRKTTNGSSDSSRKRTKSVDTNSNTPRTRKSKKS